MSTRVLVGMSGGIDSSVAALLLKRAGRDVIGVTMMVYSGAAAEGASDSCYGPGEAEDADLASRVCGELGIAHRVVDLKAEYRALVIEYARSEYLAGRTPNPCVRCNQRVKFGLLVDRLARSEGVDFDSFATGHYCRIAWLPDRGRFALRKASDPAKDQSYFLCMLSQEQLRKALFPLGELTKARVREIAREAGLPNHDRPESQDFASGGYRAHLALPESEGPVVDGEGRRLGSHRGVWGFTVGQRRGLGVAGSAPLYVTRIEPETNTVVAGPEETLYSRDISVRDVNWAARETPSAPLRLSVKIRSRTPEAPARVTPAGEGRAAISFDEPQRAVARGQWAVFYDGDILEGGGVIE